MERLFNVLWCPGFIVLAVLLVYVIEKLDDRRED
jgi:hypothetical protein